MEENSTREDMPTATTQGEMLTAKATTWQDGLASITREIREMKQEMKNDLATFMWEFKTDFKQELNTFKEQIDYKLTENKKDLQEQKQALEEAQTRIGELEDWNIEVKQALLTTLKDQRDLKEKLIDLEGRSRRNNMRIFGIPEGAEGDSISRYIENLLRKELELPTETRLLIQRTHRSTPNRPGPGSTPRSVIVNFHQFDTKEMILKKAWQKPIRINDRLLFFDHDYPNEVVKKRKAYTDVKKILKKNGIKFQTPLTKIRIHWQEGPKTYNEPHEAAKDMLKKGLEVPRRGKQQEDSVENRIMEALPWERNQHTQMRRGAGQRAKERLQEFRR